MSQPPNMPPIPRDAEEASFTEMMPLRSAKISLKKSALLYVSIGVAIISVLGFGLRMQLLNAYSAHDAKAMMATFGVIADVSVFVILLLVQALLYFYTKPAKSFAVLMIPYCVTIFIMMSGLFDLIYPFFDRILPGHMPSDNEPADVFPLKLVHAFFGPGLREELVKAAFTLFAAWLTFRVMKHPTAPRNKLIEKIRVTGPLDGVMMGIFAGAGFTLFETSGQYVSGTAISIANQSGDVSLGIASSMALLIPRVIEGLSGHMGYAAIFGYFIGLAVIRPKSKWKLIGIGYVTAAFLHAAWDGISESNAVLYPLSILITVLAVGVLLKARQLEGLITGRMVETTGSIVVERAVPMMPVGGAPMAPPRPAPVPFAPPPAPIPFAAPPVPMPVATPMPPPTLVPTASGPLALDVDGLRIPLRAGEQIDLGAEPALAGRGAGVIGTIVPHPTRADVLGLKNGGTAQWTAYLRDGTTQTIDGSKNIRLAPGVRIDFGGGLSGSVVPAV